MFPGQTTSAINHNTHRMYIVQQEDYITTCCEECYENKGLQRAYGSRKKTLFAAKKTKKGLKELLKEDNYYERSS